MTDLDLCRFLDLGYHIIDSSDIPESTHEKLFEAAVDIHQRRSELSNPLASLETVADNLHVQVPLLNDVLESDALDGAMSSVLGSRYFRYGHSFIHRSGEYDQTYHKDSPLPWGTRGGVRSHRPNWAMVFYYPQAVTLDMGPTEILPGTQYWNVNRADTERTEGEDRFDGTISPAALNGMTEAERIQHFQKQVEDFDRHVKPLRLELPKGSLLLVHFDLFHRGTRSVSEEDRFMYKFWYVRATEPVIAKPFRSIEYQACDPRRQQLVAKNAAWLGLDVKTSEKAYETDVVVQEAERMADSHSRVESDIDSVVEACLQNDEANRRSAMYALAGHDRESISVANDLFEGTTKQARCCAAFLLGELQEPRNVDLDSLLKLVADDSDTDVRMTATNALGRTLRRRMSKKNFALPEDLVPIVTKVLRDARERNTRSGVTQSAERQCIYVALLNIVSSAAEQDLNPEALAEISDLLCTRLGVESDRYAKSTALEALARLAAMGDQQAVDASLKVLRAERWSVVGATA
ncbi:MAG: phytanoyl-CoA dioxygenase family protein [Gammaproteobacteria bacterium]|nr:phytanoyl-CoA dioxygenase family protein [Gammaproteobacteria bacterium]